MVAEMVISKVEFYIFLFFIFLAILFGLLFMFMILWTPALTFFKARIKKLPIMFLMSRTGLGKYVLGKDIWKGTAEIKNVGTIQLTDNSSIVDMKSGVRIFNVFTEFAASIPPEYSAIIQELREAGLVITNWKDYEFYLNLSKESTGLQMINDAKLEKEKNKLLMIREKLKGLKVELKPFKTYKMFDLVHMFPFNVRPEFVEARVIYKVASKIKSMKLDKQWLLYLGIFLIIAAIVVIILVKFAKSPNCPSCVCEVREAGGIISRTIQNITM